MADKVIEARVIQKIATETEWMLVDRVLYKGEIALVSNGSRVNNIKVGDGSNYFSELPYIYKGGFSGSVDRSTDGSTVLDGFYIAKEPGVYHSLGNLLVRENTFTILQKELGVWSIASETPLPTLDDYINTTQFALIDAFFTPNYLGDYNKIKWNSFKINHFAIESNMREWNILGGEFTTPTTNAYCIYLKCNKSNNEGEVYITTAQIDTIQTDYYYFLIGVINSYQPSLGAREVSMFQGFSMMSGSFVKTGRIISNDGSTYFDLDNGEFKGKFTFTNGESVEEAITNQEIYIEYSQNGIDWHSTFLYDDVFMRQKKGDGAWSNAIRIVGIQGIKGDKGADGKTQYVHIRYSANSDGSSMTTTPQANTAYIGIVTTTNSVAPTSNTSYTWAKFKGENGVPGIPGADGSSLFTWVKYADTPTSGMSDYPDDKLYIGLAYNKVTATESNNYEDYSWSLMPQNIEIGGRNLLAGTKNMSGNSSSMDIVDGSTYQGFTISKATLDVAGYRDTFVANTIDIPTGDTYTVSFYAKASANLNISCHFYSPNTTTSSVSSTGQKSTSVDGTVIVSITTEWKRYWVTWTQAETTDIKSVIVGRLQTTGTIEIAGVKLEKGNKATDWTPAPEDVEASIEQSKQNSINASKAYSDAQDELKRIQNEAYADGKVTAAEQRAIDDATAKMEASKLYAAAQDNLLRVQLEAYADGQITAEEQQRIQQMQDNLAAAKAYADAQANLAKIAAAAYADGIVDDEEARAIADATAKMELSKQHAQGLVNNIQIGGRNLAIDSEQPIWTRNDVGLGTSVKMEDATGKFTRTTPDAGKRVSVYGHSYAGFESGKFSRSMYVRHFHTSNVTIWGQSIPPNIWTWIKEESYSNLNGWNGYESNTPSIAIDTKKFKLEKGNKATDWTPAPEDVDNAINEVKTKAEQALTQLTSIANDNVLSPSEKQQISNEWNRIKSEYTSNYSLGISNGVDTANLTSAYNDLFNYINPLLVDISVESSIVGDVFRAKFKAYYDQNIALLVAINDKIKQGINNNANNINNLNSSIARINQITSFLNTTVNGNVIGTGILMVGSEAQSNAGISGLNEAGSKSVRLWAGGTAQNRDKAAWNTLDDGTMQFFHPNGNIAFRFGLSNGKFIMDGYHEQGMKLWELSPNRGLVNVAYIPESWNTTHMININQSSSTLDVANAKTTVVNLMSIMSVNDYRTYVASANYTSFEYQNGTHPDNAQYANLIGYKTMNDSRTSNIPNGWYGLEVGEIDMDYEPSNGELPPIKTIVYFLYYIENGKVTKNQSIQFTDRDIENKQHINS